MFVCALFRRKPLIQWYFVSLQYKLYTFFVIMRWLQKKKNPPKWPLLFYVRGFYRRTRPRQGRSLSLSLSLSVYMQIIEHSQASEFQVGVLRYCEGFFFLFSFVSKDIFFFQIVFWPSAKIRRCTLMHTHRVPDWGGFTLALLVASISFIDFSLWISHCQRGGERKWKIEWSCRLPIEKEHHE